MRRAAENGSSADIAQPGATCYSGSGRSSWRKWERQDEQVGTGGASGRPDRNEQGRREGDAVDSVFETIGEALVSGEEVRILGFGTFGTRNRPARTGRNPGTGEQVEIAASTAPAFKAGMTLKNAVNSRNRG